MTSLFDLLSQNQENEKVISSLRKMSRKKRAAPEGAAHKTAGLPSADSNNSFDEIIRDFTAIDVETTGLDPKSDRIIELGAVRYSRGKIQEEFSSFVNPGKPIPVPITRLTGISDADVSAAPLFAEIVESFLTFIGTVPLCGHQIDFDLNFLNSELKRAGREKLSSPEIDTALLSRIITPGIGRYSLKNLTNSLEIKLENAHRALDDARASGQAACALLARVSTVAPHIRAAMARFAPPSVIKSILFDSIRYKVNAGVNQPSLRLQVSPKKLVPSSSRQTIGVETIRQVFAHTGKLAEIMPGFIERPSQTAMAQGAMEALNTGSIFIAEAGTGTGKSLAYLIPSALYALKNNCRVLISTHTRNLQDQLISKDLPVVEKVLGEKLEYSVLKGRSNYLCIRQFYRLLSGDLADLSYRERMGMLPLIRWAMETKTGDIEEQNQFNIKWFSRIWRMLSADAHVCEGKRCAEFADCYLQRARQSALGSHIVIINHALFFSELCSESSFLGSLGAIVFDEAHHLESCGHRYLRVEVDTNRCTQFVDNLVQIEKEMKKRPLPQMPEINDGDIKALVKRMRVATGAFLDDCSAWVESRHPPADEFQCAYGASVFDQTAG
ncbi:MAG TPA: exonuclease domain-containing protein, partial [Chitinivibrionales bacterium]